MRRAPTIKLDIPVRKELERLSRSRSVAVRLAERSRIVLLAAGGLDNQEIAAKLDITRQKAGRWRDRFVEDGLGGIEKDASRSGRIPSIGRRKRARIVKKTVEGKPPNATHWSRSLMARATGVSESTVGRIWRAHGLKPHLARTFKLSNDKQFVEKLEDVVGLYLNPPENAIVLSCDEKSQMQALDRTQPGLPLKKGRCGTLTHDYKRNGTTTMFAALNTLLPVSAVLAALRGIEAVAPPGYRIHRDPHAGAVPIRIMSNVTHPPRTAHPGPPAESACLRVVPLRDHVPINRIARDS